MPLHLSVPIENTMEPIEMTEISPLISKCYIKVCYVGQQPNRNNTVITKEVATEMGRKILGSPVVGFFDKETQDFDTHNRELIVQDGKYELIDITRPYGFVPTNANVWFQKFNDEGTEREYLVTEGYIWTGAYPESKRIIDKGNNQSMELTNDSGFWTETDRAGCRVFIYNEAVIEKLCILGENVEPCFEGAQITSFSLDTNNKDFQEFKNSVYSIISDLKDTFNKGGSSKAMDNENLNAPAVDEEINSDFSHGGSNSGAEPDKKEKDKEKEKNTGTNANEDSDDENKDKDKDKKKYNLDEVAEYQELLVKYNALQAQYSTLQQDKQTLDSELNTLRQFKLDTERQNKKAMIDSFYMLNDEQKKDVINNMDTYSLDDIEAKLSILYVRNRVNFNKTTENQELSKPEGMFNLSASDQDGLPDWIKAVQSNEQN